jgi:hypothetical protein
MISHLLINIECGNETCASKPGVFCKYLGTTKFGTNYVCVLFPNQNPGRKEHGGVTPLQEDKPGGSLLRCTACLNAEGNMIDLERLWAGDD